ncbi:MAG: ATP-binding cassette domain-containing protein [Saprospiraceae bacterium]|mgnify:CR=1 FL=1|nr:ATP-binding cassette domain-containing protein [Saprospiraceae bacterium]MCB9318951.1 ATP-binding cassette domain-containing protein [Lewinellaceae bacterium]
MDIQIEGLTKYYGPQKAVDSISFSVKTGEILGFLGPNGAGKTTTMKMITQYLSLDEGDIRLGGQSVKDQNLKRFIGYLPEHNPLYHEMPVYDYLAYCAALQDVPKDKINDRVRQMIKVCGLNVEKHKNIGELSKGFRQRVGLAQAMIHDPEILILDEPTTGLDPNQIVEIRDLIRHLGKEKTVILSTHILPEVEATCDRILIINRGKIVADGTANTLRSQAQGNHITRTRIKGAAADSAFQALQALPMVRKVNLEDKAQARFVVESNQDANEAIFELCVKQGWILLELTPLETKLEDIFRDLTMN